MMLEGMRPIGANKVCKLESNSRQLTTNELSEGMWVRGHIWEYEFEVGRIHFSNEEPTDSVYVCQDSFTGENTHLAYGFKYSWWLPKSCLNIEGTKENTCQLYRIPAPEPVGPQTPAPPAFKVGDDVEVVSHWNYAKGEKLKVVKEENGRIWIGREHGQGYAVVRRDDIIKLLPPEHKPEPLMICPKAGAFTKCATCSAANPHKKDNFCDKNYCGCDFCIPYEPEASTTKTVPDGYTFTNGNEPTVKIRKATHGEVSRTTLEVDKHIFPLSDTKGINAALKPYGLHIQKTGKRG